MNNRENSLKNTREQLNAIGPGMCLAKWSQTTLHLSTGHTHSCHHPKTHIIPISEIKRNPSALHNTSTKKEARKEMMSGTRPAECHYCWNVEDSVPDGITNIFSDRTLKSNEDWSKPHFNKIKEIGHTGDINPSYLEVSFSYACNFKCAYCSPEISSKWMEEIEKFGAYPTSRQYNNLEHVKNQNKMPIPVREENPYVEAFWQWWPELYPTLHTFRITGGEPLMAKDTFKVLDYIIENPNTGLELAINSNCVVPDKLFEEFVKKVKIILERKLVKSFTLYTSCEAHGAKAEYIRNGLDYQVWLDNCNFFLKEIPTANFSIMSTYNALSITSYVDFLKDVYELKKHSNSHRFVGIDIPYLDHPKWMNVGILPMSYKDLVLEQLDYMNAHLDLFRDWEVKKLERIQYLFKETPDYVEQGDFVLFFDEHDKRRNTNFLATFPEMEGFYKYCKRLIRVDNTPI